MLEQAIVARAGLARPEVSPRQVREVLAQHFGLEGSIVELGSQQDRNFRVDTPMGRFVLKICRSEYDPVELDAQNKAMKFIAEREPSIAVAVPQRSLSGEEIVTVAFGAQQCHVRLLSYVDGEQLTRRTYLSAKTRETLGTLAGRVALALSGFSHPGLERDLQWDMRKAASVTRSLLDAIGDDDVRNTILEVLAKSEAAIAGKASALRTRPVHQDITDDNIVAAIDADGHCIPNGVIDFGDLMYGWIAGDLAVTCAALLHHAGGDPFFILPAIAAFHRIHPLDEAEVDCLWPLIVQRACVLVASSEQQLAVDPDNSYVLGNIDHEREIFRTAISLPIAVMQAAIRQRLGFEQPASATVTGSLLGDVPASAFSIVRLDSLSDDFRSGNWMEKGVEQKLLADHARATGFSITRYGEHRLSRTKHHSSTAPATHALFIEVWLPAATKLRAPFSSTVVRAGDEWVLKGGDFDLYISGPISAISTGNVSAGGHIAVTDASGVVAVQLARAGSERPPRFVEPHTAAAWKTVSPSPSALFGGAFDAPQIESERLLAIRHEHFAKPQKNYYVKPPQIERGYRQQMYATDGRTYLDMVNNVAILGHGHEKLSEAVGRQWSLLNTNSRFHYAGVAEFSKRLADLAPEGLDTVFLVNSGSEANDLAIRLAWAHSGARNILCLLEAYHGWTVASDAVSTSIADNPQALTTRPSWVHAVTSPNTFRGPFRGPDSGAGYVAEVDRALGQLDARGERLGGFICESVYGNSGGIPLPKGYLREVYQRVRDRGGVTIADEVQVGYGRLGHYFWGFEEQGVVPDIITVAKGMGNGHPLGAVITSRAIADSLEKEGYFFSSAGGSPVSCVVGMTVLDALRDEKLIENAKTVGDHLKSRLEALGQRFPLVGAVHGMGLYLGLEFVRNRETLEPATVETARICDRLLELGVIMQPTGDHLNVLKIKPPLCLSKESADFFAEMLAKVLEEGW